jgi:hypothetical protein
MALALLTAFAVMAFRIFMHLMGTAPEGTDFMLVHFLALVTIVFFTGQRLLARPQQVGFADLLREGFRNAAIYAVVLGAFVWLFYATIDVEFFRLKVNAMVERGMSEGQPEAIIRPRLEKFFTPFNYATITFFALVAGSAVLSFLLGLLHHKVLRRFRQ